MHDQTQFLTSLLPYCVNIHQLFTKIVESVEIYHMNLGSGKIKCSKVKRGYFEQWVILYCSNISETTEASELNGVGYNLL